MARGAPTCDVCGNETDEIVIKLYYSPIRRGQTSFNHSKYTHHLDVGSCCRERLLNGFKWRKRMTAAEYHDSRRKRAAS